MQKDNDSKAKMKAYDDQKRQVKPHNLNAGDMTLAKKWRLNKASPHFEPLPYTVLDVKGCMILADEQSIRKKSPAIAPISKKLPNPPGSTIPDTEPAPTDEQVPLDFEGPEVCQPVQPQHPKRNLVRHTQAKLMVAKTTQGLQQQSNLPLHHPYPPAVVD